MGYKPHSLTIDPDSFGANPPVYIPDITDIDLPANPELLADLVGHVISPTHIALGAVKPVLTITTFAVDDTLDQVGSTGILIDSSSNTGVLLNLAKLDDAGDVASGGVHRSLQFLKGVLVPTRITIDNRNNARLTLAMYPIDKSGSLITISDTLTLPTIALASKRFTLGQMTVGSVSLSDYNNLEVDLGNTVETDGSQSSVNDTHVAQKAHEPSINIRGIDPTWFAAAGIPLAGKAAAHADTILYLRKRSQDGNSFVADGTAEHIKLTMAGMAVVDSAIRGQATRINETALRIAGVRDASGNNPLIVTTGSAIT